jgi:iron complex transport system substrate-binding protein
VPAQFDGLAREGFYAGINTEQLSLLEQNDLVGWITVPATVNSGLDPQPGHPALRVGREGCVVGLTEEQGVALSFSSVLSLPALLDQLPAEFVAHLGT